MPIEKRETYNSKTQKGEAPKPNRVGNMKDYL